MAGRLGVAPANVLAVAVTITVGKTSGPTRVWLGIGAHRPREPALVSEGRPTSAFAIVPVSALGAIRLWNGSRRAPVTLDVSGWFSTAHLAPAGTAGLFTRLAGRQVVRGAVGGGKARAFALPGKADLPKAGVGSVLVRLRVSKARAPGAVGVGPTRRSAGATAALVHGRGTASGLAVATLRAGRLVVRNRSTRRAIVAVDALGYFSNGSRSHAFGDTLKLVAPRSLLAATVGKEGRSVVTAGAGGVPAETTSTPPSLVLARTVVAGPTRSGSLLAFPKDSIPLAPALSWRRHGAAAGLVLMQPADSNRTTLATTSGAARIAGSAYAYFSGGTVMAEGLHRLDETDVVAELRPDAVVFTGAPGNLADLTAGDLIVDSGATGTSGGFLRRVVSAELVDGNLVVTTTDAAITDAFEQIHISWGAVIGAPKESPPTASQLGRRASTTLASCNPRFWLVGLSLDCSAHAGPVTLEHVLSAEFSASIDVGFLGPRVTTQLTVSDTAAATLGSPIDQDVNVSKKLAEYFFLCPGGVAGRLVSNCSIEIGGPLPIFLTPSASVGLKATGHVSGGFSSTGSVSFSATATHDGLGDRLTHAASRAGTGHNESRSAQTEVKVSVVPAVNFYISVGPVMRYGSETVEPPGFKASLGLSPFLRFTADECVLAGYAGLDFNAGVSLAAFGHTLVSAGWSHTLAQARLFGLNWQNCAIWSGTIDYLAQLHWSGVDYTRDVNASSQMTIPFQKIPPRPSMYGGGRIYKAKGQASGRQVEHAVGTCYDAEGYPHVYRDRTLRTWGGEIRMGSASGPGPRPEVDIFPLNRKIGGRDAWALGLANGGTGPYEPFTSVPTDWTHSGMKETYGCDPIPDEHTHDAAWFFDVFGLYGGLGLGADPNTLYFTIPPGAGSTSGVRKVPEGINAEGYTVHFTLKKTCSRGGTDC